MACGKNVSSLAVSDRSRDSDGAEFSTPRTTPTPATSTPYASLENLRPASSASGRACESPILPATGGDAGTPRPRNRHVRKPKAPLFQRFSSVIDYRSKSGGDGASGDGSASPAPESSPDDRRRSVDWHDKRTAFRDRGFASANSTLGGRGVPEPVFESPRRQEQQSQQHQQQRTPADLSASPSSKTSPSKSPRRPNNVRTSSEPGGGVVIERDGNANDMRTISSTSSSMAATKDASPLLCAALAASVPAKVTTRSRFLSQPRDDDEEDDSAASAISAATVPTNNLSWESPAKSSSSAISDDSFARYVTSHLRNNSSPSSDSFNVTLQESVVVESSKSALAAPPPKTAPPSGATTASTSTLAGAARSRNESLKRRSAEVGRVASWATKFDKLLNDEVGKDLFKQFLRHEYSEENMRFWEAVEEFRALAASLSTKSVLRKRAKRIYDDFLAADALDPVNVDARGKQLVEEAIKSGSTAASTFSAAQTQILNLMKCDSYPRFLKSGLYKAQLVKEMEGKALTLPLQRSATLTPDMMNANASRKSDALGAKSTSNVLSKEQKLRQSLLPWNRVKKPKKAPQRANTEELPYTGAFVEARAGGDAGSGKRTKSSSGKRAGGDKKTSRAAKSKSEDGKAKLEPSSSRLSIVNKLSALKLPLQRKRGSSKQGSRESVADVKESSLDGEDDEGDHRVPAKKHAFVSCRVRINDSDPPLVFKGDPQASIKDALGELLRSHGVSHSAMDVYHLNSDKPMNVDAPLSNLNEKEVVIESRVLFRLDLPGMSKSLGIKARPDKPFLDILRPILARYDFAEDVDAVKLVVEAKALEASAKDLTGYRAARFDGDRIVVVHADDHIPFADSDVVGDGHHHPHLQRAVNDGSEKLVSAAPPPPPDPAISTTNILPRDLSTPDRALEGPLPSPRRALRFYSDADAREFQRSSAEKKELRSESATESPRRGRSGAGPADCLVTAPDGVVRLTLKEDEGNLSPNSRRAAKVTSV